MVQRGIVNRGPCLGIRNQIFVRGCSNRNGFISLNSLSDGTEKLPLYKLHSEPLLCISATSNRSYPTEDHSALQLWKTEPRSLDLWINFTLSVYKRGKVCLIIDQFSLILWKSWINFAHLRTFSTYSVEKLATIVFPSDDLPLPLWKNGAIWFQLRIIPMDSVENGAKPPFPSEHIHTINNKNSANPPPLPFFPPSH